MAVLAVPRAAYTTTKQRVREWTDRLLGLFINPKKGSHVAGLDTIRGIAVAFVVIYHSWALSLTPLWVIHLPVVNAELEPYRFISGMGLGVDIFFVLSGFLLTLPWHKAYYDNKPTPRFGTYIRRRLWRIVPPYWFMLFVLLLLWTNTTIAWSGVVGKVGAFTVMAHLLFMQELFPISSSSFGVNGALWTLTLEMTFYVVLPIFVLLFLGRRWLVGLALTSTFSLGYLYLVRHSVQPVVDLYSASVPQVPQSTIRMFLSHQFLGYLPEFGLGIALANYWTYRNHRPDLRWVQVVRSEGMCFATTIAGIILLGFALYHVLDMEQSDIYYLTNSMIAALGSGLLILGSQSVGGFLRRMYAFLPLRLFGVIGYSVFLWHFPLIISAENYPIFTGVTSLHRFGVMLLLIFPVVTAVGVVLFLLVEKPFIENRKPLDASMSVSRAAGMDDPIPQTRQQLQQMRQPVAVQIAPARLLEANERNDIPLSEVPTRPMRALSRPRVAPPRLERLPHHDQRER